MDAMTIRKVAAGRTGPAFVAETRTSLTFLCSSISAELNDLERSLHHIPFADRLLVAEHADRVRALLVEVEKHIEPDTVIRESLVRDDEPTLSSERDTRENT